MKSMTGVPDAEIDKITHGNAMRHFRYDPFAHIPDSRPPWARCAHQAVGWDISIRSVKHLRPAQP